MEVGAPTIVTAISAAGADTNTLAEAELFAGLRSVSCEPTLAVLVASPGTSGAVANTVTVADP